MWKQAFDLAKKFFTLALELERTQREVDDLRAELRQVQTDLDRVLIELQAMRRDQSTDYERALLKLENEFLRLEKRVTVGLLASGKKKRRRQK